MPYPWDGLEDQLNASGQDRLCLVSYGSLLNAASAARTIADTPTKGHSPVLAFGGYRIFNYLMPTYALHRYSQAEGQIGDRRAALNAVWSGHVTDIFNGRLIPIACHDLPGLRKRERGYDLAPMWTVSWHDPNQEPIVGYVLCASDQPCNGVVYMDNRLRPHDGYLELCRHGAAAVSCTFE